MTTGSVLFILAVGLVVLLFIARPFLLPHQAERPVSDRAVLEAEKEAMLARIRALDFDRETGKQAEADHAAERELLVTRTADLLARLDELGSDEDIDALIEERVQRLIAAEAEDSNE